MPKARTGGKKAATENSDFEEWCQQEFNPAAAFSKPEVLKGYRVLSCTQYILGPSCAAYLGELGAEVIKIEQPRTGEPMRHTTPWNEPLLYPLSRWVPERGTGLGFFGANYNEYFVGLDFHRPEARELMYKLAAKADVVVENYRPGTFDRWGHGRNRASYDILGQAQGGAFGITGWQEEFGGFPSKHTIWLADYWGGMMQAVNILAALYWRDTVSGEGTFLEYSQVDGVTRQLEWSLPVYGRYGVVRQRWGGWDTELCVNGIIGCGKSSYPDSDNPQEQEEGFITITAYQDEDFARLCDVIGRQDLAKKYPDLDSRVVADSQREIYAALEEWAKDKTKEEVASTLDESDILNQPVWNAKEVAEQPHWRERGSIGWLDDPTFGDVLAQGPGYKLSATPPRVRSAFKPVGADNEFVYAKLAGLSNEEIM